MSNSWNRAQAIKAAKRDRAMAADFIGGMRQRDLAKKYGIGQRYVSCRLSARGVTLTPEQIRNRVVAALGTGKKRGRKPVWPDCPDHIRPEYDRLRRKGVRSAEAREILEREL